MSTEINFEELERKAKEERQKLIKDTISALFSPCTQLDESNDQIRPTEMLRRMRGELPIDLGYMELVEALISLGFVRQAVHGELFWLIKFA